MITQRYKLNTVPCGVYPLVSVSQYDTAREIKFELYEEDSQIIPTNAAILIGTNQYEGTIENGIVSFIVPSELTQEAKTVFGEVRETDAEGHFGTLNFYFAVDSTPIEQSSSLSLASASSSSKSLGNGLKLDSIKIDGNLVSFEEEETEEPSEDLTDEEMKELIEEQTKAYEEDTEQAPSDIEEK